MKDSNSYLRDRDVKHLQGPLLSRTKRVRDRVLTLQREKLSFAVPTCVHRETMCVQLTICGTRRRQVDLQGHFRLSRT